MSSLTVHRGFMRSLSNLYDDLSKRLQQQGVNCGVEVLVTGHSLGGAMATLFSMALLCKGYSNVVLVTFGAPSAVSRGFKAQMEKFMSSGQLKVYRIVNRSDPINYLVQLGSTVLPGIVPEYVHVKKAVYLDPWLAGLCKGITHLVSTIWQTISGGITNLISLVKSLGDWFRNSFYNFTEHLLNKYISNLELCWSGSADRFFAHTLDVVKHVAWSAVKWVGNSVKGLIPDCVKDAVASVWNWGADCLRSAAGFCGQFLLRGLRSLGGVEVGGRARLLGGSIKGSCLVLNLAQGCIHPRILAAAFDHVFSMFGRQDPSFSLDPREPYRPDDPYQQRACWPDSVKDTIIEHIMWEADWRMKQYNFEMLWDDDTQQKRQVDFGLLQRCGVRRYPRYDLSQASTNEAKHEIHRLWFCCDGVDVRISQDGGTLDLHAHMRVKVQRMDESAGGLQDIDAASSPHARQFAASLTEEFGQWAQVEPSFSALANLQCAVALAKYFRDELQVPPSMLNRAWLQEHTQEKPDMKYARFAVPKLSNIFTHESTEVLSDGVRHSTRTKTVSGGVNMSHDLNLQRSANVDKVADPLAKKCHDLASLPCYNLEPPQQEFDPASGPVRKEQSTFEPSSRVHDQVVPVPLFLPDCSAPGCCRPVSLPERPEMWRSVTSSTCGGQPWCWEHHPLRCTDEACPQPALTALEGLSGWSRGVSCRGRVCHRGCAAGWFRKGKFLQVRGVAKAGYNQRILPVEAVDKLQGRIRLDNSSGETKGSVWSLRPQNLLDPEEFWAEGQPAVVHTVKSDASLLLAMGSVRGVTDVGRIQLRFPGLKTEKTLRPENLWTVGSLVLVARLQTRPERNGSKATIVGFVQKENGLRAEVEVASEKWSVPLTALDPVN
mmetsp:Transcript_57624/g.126268  ORF Transcript_57624/g.126268 Transcript_57624/m.126268 type:complete len:886 (+) Transcript_57624:437-3094(+)